MPKCVFFKKILIQDRDYERTIGINTGYIHTNDYDVEDNDKEYLFEVYRAVLLIRIGISLPRDLPSLKEI